MKSYSRTQQEQQQQPEAAQIKIYEDYGQWREDGDGDAGRLEKVKGEMKEQLFKEIFQKIKQEQTQSTVAFSTVNEDNSRVTQVMKPTGNHLQGLRSS